MEEKREVTDEDLDRIAARIRSIRRRETMAKLAGVGTGLVLSVGIYGASYALFGRDGGGRLTLALAAGGLFLGALVWRALSPKEDPNDVE